MRNRLTYATFGVLATLVGVALGHLVAALTNPAASPVLAVGSQVIDLTPTPMKEWAIRQFGTNDKAILIGSVFAGVLALSAVAGLLARRRFVLGAATLLVLVAVALRILFIGITFLAVNFGITHVESGTVSRATRPASRPGRGAGPAADVESWIEEEGDPLLPGDYADWRAEGLLAEKDGRLRFTERGFLLSNEVLCRFV